jgi:hypothetical protein
VRPLRVAGRFEGLDAAAPRELGFGLLALALVAPLAARRRNRSQIRITSAVSRATAQPEAEVSISSKSTPSEA